MLFVFLLFIVIFLNGNGRVYGQCNTVSLQIIDRPACEAADPNQNCQVESSKTTYYCWLENGKCVTDYNWTGCYDENVNGTLQCVFHQNLVKIDCDNPPGQGGGGSFEYQVCPDWTWLTCGTTDEAQSQGKYACFYKSYCNNYFFPSSLDAPAPCNENPASAMCRANCSCCPIDSYRSCTQGSQYTTTVTVDLTNESVETRNAKKVSCNQWHGHDDIFVSNVMTRDYYNAWGDHLQDWDLTCITNTCGCVAPTGATCA